MLRCGDAVLTLACKSVCRIALEGLRVMQDGFRSGLAAPTCASLVFQFRFTQTFGRPMLWGGFFHWCQSAPRAPCSAGRCVTLAVGG